MKTILSIAASLSIGMALLLALGLLVANYSERPTQEAYERCLAEEARAHFSRCMSGKLDIDLGVNGWESRDQYCRSGIGIAREMARLYGICPLPRKSN